MPLSRPHRPARLAVALIATATLAGVALTVGGESPSRAAPATDPLDARREQVRALEAELSRIDAATAAAADELGEARGTHAHLDQRVQTTGTRLVAARRTHARSQENLRGRLVALYAQPQIDATAVLLTSGSLSQTLAAQQVLDRVAAADARLVERAHRARVRLAATRQRLIDERRQAAAEQRRAAERLATMRGLLNDRQRVLEQARAALDGLIAAREREAALARARAAAEREARRRTLRAQRAARAAAARPAAAPDPAPAPATTAASDPSPAPAPSGGGGHGPVAGGPSWATLERIAQCESGGNPRAVSSNGTYRGKYQFDHSTWATVGGSGDPAAAGEAEQDRRAAMLYISRGPSPWPICGYR